MVIAALAILGAMALGGLGTSVYLVLVCARVIRRMSDQITAVGEYQLERIRVENGAEAVSSWAKRAQAETSVPTRNGWVPPVEEPDMVIPGNR